LPARPLLLLPVAALCWHQWWPPAAVNALEVEKERRIKREEERDLERRVCEREVRAKGR